MLPVLDELGGARTRGEAARCRPPAAPTRVEGGLRGYPNRGQSYPQKNPATRLGLMIIAQEWITQR